MPLARTVGDRCRCFVGSRGVLSSLGFVATVVHAGETLACNGPPREEHEITGVPGGAAPARVEDVTVAVQRGTARAGGCFGQTSTSCDDIGTVGFYFRPPTDADSPPEDLGYAIRVVRGDARDIVVEGTFKARVDGDEAALEFSWVDGATDEQESISFTVQIQAVDADGNRGPESEPIAVADSGGSGCDIGGSRSSSMPISALGMWLAILLACARRLHGTMRRSTCSCSSMAKARRSPTQTR